MSRPTQEEAEETVELCRQLGHSKFENYAKAYLELLDENEREKCTKHAACNPQGDCVYCDVEQFEEENAKLRKVVVAARAFEDEGTGIMQGCGCAVCKILEAIRDLDEMKLPGDQ